MPYLGKSPSQAVRRRYQYLASASDTSVSGSDANGNTLLFSDGEYVDVYLNGVKLKAGTDYNTDTANTIASLAALAANDEITVIVYDTFGVFSGTFTNDITVGGTANLGSVSVDNITIDGTEIDLSSGDLTIDVAGDIILDADGADVSFRDAGTGHLSISNSSNDAVITSLQTDKDMIFKGVDGGSLITALTLDMSDAGTATFNHDIVLGDNSKALFGAGSDLEILHNSSSGNSFISDVGTGSLIISSNQALFQSADKSETLMQVNENSDVKLFHDNTERLATTGSGIDVSGSIQVDDGGSLGFGGTNYKIEGSSSANHRIAFHTDGSERMRINSSGNVGIGETNPDAPLHITSNTPIISFDESDASQEFRIGSFGGVFAVHDVTDSAYRMVIDGDGKVIIGDTASHTDDFLQIESPASGGGHGIQIRRNDSNNDQTVGRVQFGNNTDVDLGIVSCKTDGATNTGAIIVSTASAGTTAERFRVTSAGIHIGGTGSANALDDYEEGTWTPVISANAVPTAYGSQLGDYVKIGRQVTILFTINISTIGSFSGAQVKVTGLPFASGNLNRHSFGTLFLDGTASEVQAAGDLAIRVTNNSSQVLFQRNSGNTADDNNINANKIDTGTFIHGSVTYFTD